MHIALQECTDHSVMCVATRYTECQWFALGSSRLEYPEADVTSAPGLVLRQEHQCLRLGGSGSLGLASEFDVGGALQVGQGL